MTAIITIASFIAVLCCGAFFGAALYIALVQHPAAREAGVGGVFFPPMYRRAAPMQIALALAGSIAGAICGIAFGEVRWVVGAGLLFAVIPITLILIKPTNDRLLDPNTDLRWQSTQTRALLEKWARLHWIRIASSGAAFVVYLIEFAR